MLTLNDGRTELWQWDTSRKLTVDADCSQVHFSNKVFGRSIDVDAVGGVAIIPDILLQTDKDLNVWAFVGTAENGYTKISKTFKVNRRNKPADYVFTPPDQTTLGELVERLGKIEESQDPDAIKNAVDDYLANNPIMVKETDPTVPEWAKYPTKPSYTAAEVGAQPAGNYLTEIEIKPVIEAANSAQALAKQADKKVDTLREVVSKFHSNIVEEAKGDIITLDDASDMELAGLNLYGKTIQNGTPTPDAPVELESVGNDGNVAVSVCGKNLLNPSHYKVASATEQYKTMAKLVAGLTFLPGVTYTLSFDTENTGCLAYFNEAFSKTYKEFTMDGKRKSHSFVYDTEKVCPDGTAIVSRGATTAGVASGLISNIQLEISTTATEYEPYNNGGSVTAQTPNGLPGIPVSSGGNYTDENGQQWVCDEVNFARGKYVQRVCRLTNPTKVISGYHNDVGTFVGRLVDDSLYNSDELKVGTVMCNSLPATLGRTQWFANQSCLSTGKNNVLLTVKDITTIDELRAWLASHPLDILYALASPIETDLPAEEIAQYSALHTNYPNTTVYNDEGAGMTVKYVADTKLYIDNKFTELQNAILSAGANI